MSETKRVGTPPLPRPTSPSKKALSPEKLTPPSRSDSPRPVSSPPLARADISILNPEQRLITDTVNASSVQAKLLMPGIPRPPLTIDELKSLADNFTENSTNGDILKVLGIFYTKADAATKSILENALLTGVLFGANTVLSFFINDGHSIFFMNNFAAFFRELPRELQTSLFEKYLLSEAMGNDAVLSGSNEEGLISASLNRFIAAKDFTGLEREVLAEIDFMRSIIETNYPIARDGINYNPALAYLRALKRILELEILKKGRNPQLFAVVQRLSSQWPDWLNPPQNEYKVLELDPDLNYFQSVFLSHQARAAFDSFQYARTFLRNLGYSNLRHEILTHLETEQSKILKMWPENFRAPDAEIGILSDQLHAINQQLSAPLLMDGAVKRKLMVEKALVMQRLNLARKTALMRQFPDLALAFTLEKAIEHNRIDPGNRQRYAELAHCYASAAAAINVTEPNSLASIYLNGLGLRSMNEAGLPEQEKQSLIEITVRQIIERFQPATLQRLSRNAHDTFGLQIALYNEALPREGIGFFLNPRVSDQVIAKTRELLPHYRQVEGASGNPENFSAPSIAGQGSVGGAADDLESDDDEDLAPTQILSKSGAPPPSKPATPDRRVPVPSSSLMGAEPMMQASASLTSDQDLDHDPTRLLPRSPLPPQQAPSSAQGGGSPPPPILPPIPRESSPVSASPPLPPPPPPVEVISPGRKAIGYIAQLAAQIVSLETPAFQRNNNLTQILNLAETYPETRQAAFDALMRLIPQLPDVNFVISDQTDYASWQNGDPKSYVFLPDGYQSPTTTFLLHLFAGRELKMLQGADGEQKSMELLEALLAKGARLDLQNNPDRNSLLQKALQANNWPAVHVIINKIAEMPIPRPVDKTAKLQLLKGKTSLPYRLSALEFLIRSGQPRLAVELIRAGAEIAGYVPETDDPDEGQIDSDHESGDLEYLRILTLATVAQGTSQDAQADRELVEAIKAKLPISLRRLPLKQGINSQDVSQSITAKKPQILFRCPEIVHILGKEKEQYKPFLEEFLRKSQWHDISYETVVAEIKTQGSVAQAIMLEFIGVLYGMKDLFGEDLIELRGLQMPRDEQQLNLLLYQKYSNTFGRV